ncbi:MAG: hypothetical protein C5B51_08890 [Terriglobia bacterium]|nr:MAG: hypothetical protein C5B51_08890 [Terriglobia bacterium]
MALTSTGLTNGGRTAHYQFQFDDSLSAPINPGGPEPARTNAVIAACENDFNQMSGFFGNIGLGVNTPIAVNVTQDSGGARWDLDSGNLTVTIKPDVTGSATFVRYLMVAEITEVFMRAQGRGWFGDHTEGSEGEGLSRFLANQFLIINGLGNNPPTNFDNSNSWLSSTRQDFVNHINNTDDGPDEITGCSLLFLWYLFAQLGFTVNQIVAAGASNLGEVYRNLTGDTGDPFPFFKQLMDTAFPGTSTITSGNLDNPFPLGILSFWVDKSTYGVDEVTDVIHSASGGTFPEAFFLVLEGFNINQFNALGIGAPALSGAFAALPGLSMTAHPAEFEDPNPNVPQRIRFSFDVTFTTATLAAFPAAGNPPVFELLNAQINVGGNPLPDATAATQFELIAGADPYFTNIDPQQDNVFYLSQDLRVFTATPRRNATPVAGAPAFTSDSFDGAYNYIQGVLGFLNDPANGFTDGTNDPFASGVIPQPADSLSSDSSVSAVTIQGGFPPQFFNNYNFAISRVRLRGTAGPGGEARNVRVFFRMWSTQTADTGFDPSSTYLSQLDSGHPRFPLPAPDSHTVPFFATGNAPDPNDPNNPEYGTNGINNRTITIDTGDTKWAYFGCFLNVFDPANVVNGSRVQALMAGTHHCLVAEIAFDDAPIVNANGVVESPENSDKLAQRNLQVTISDNPGPAVTHLIPQTFDLKPGRAISTTPGDLTDYPDELMIDWGNTPAGSRAQIFWPQIDASAVLGLANRLYGTHLLTAADANTIEAPVTRGVTYVPIPSGQTENIAGLISVQLPTNISVGQEFNLLVRRVSTREVVIIEAPGIAAPRPAAPDKPARATALPEGTDGGGTFPHPDIPPGPPTPPHTTLNWRYVTGTFQVKIPVTTEEVMLRPDQDALAVFKWRLENMPVGSRWHPVVERQIDFLSQRIIGLGGDPDAIPPSPDGAPLKIDTKGQGSLAISFTASGGGPVSDRADIVVKARQESDERLIRHWNTEKTLFVRHLNAANGGIYEVQAISDQHEIEGQFAAIREGKLTQVVLVLKKKHHK